MENTVLCRVIQFGVKLSYYFLKYKMPDIYDTVNSFSKLPSLIKKDGLKKPLIVTDKRLVELGVVNPFIEMCTKENIEYALFDDVIPNPTCENVEKGAEKYKESGCDCLVAIGGGSPMDTAKLIGGKVVRPKKDIRRFSVLFPIRKKIPMLYAVPTTAGTGSDGTCAAVITNEKTSRKVPMFDPVIMPKRAILDPVLTVGLPPFLTATTGMDALCHAVEAYTNHTYCTRYENKLALDAIKLIYENILCAFNDGNNIEARHNMQLAAIYAGRAFCRGSVGYVHAVGHTLSGLYHIGHGEAMTVILPKVLRRYGKSAHKRLSEISDYIGIKGNNIEEKANNFITWIEDTNRKMSMRTKFKEIQPNDVETMVKWAVKESNPLYPCPQVWKKKDFRELIHDLMVNE